VEVNKMRTVACVVLAGVSGLLVAVGASGVGTPSGGQIRVFVTPGNGQGNGTILIAGAIGDYGKTSQEKDGIGKVTLSKGTFEVNLRAITKAINNARPTIANKTTCSGVFSGTAPVTLSNGTGAYKGISGTLMLTETFAGYGPFYKTGANKGKCNFTSNANPIAQWGSVTGVGTVKFA
jgi:hypothetical protein